MAAFTEYCPNGECVDGVADEVMQNQTDVPAVSVNETQVSEVLDAAFSDKKNVNIANTAIRDAEKLFDLDLSTASEVVNTRNETVVTELVTQAQETVSSIWGSTNWVSDWFGYSDADQNQGTERKGARDT